MPSGSSSSSSSSKDKAKADAKKAYLKKADPSTVEELVDGGELEKKWFNDEDGAGSWRPAWADIQFDADACLKDVLNNKADGFYAPAGTVLPLGAQLPEMTVLRYGGYIPQGTSFPGGVMIPMHARMVNLLPQETKKSSAPEQSESMCAVQ